jgi:hypothetical protein
MMGFLLKKHIIDTLINEEFNPNERINNEHVDEGDKKRWDGV